MTNNDQIRDKKTTISEIWALSSGKVDKYEYITGNKILPSNQQQIIEQANFTYLPLGKLFKKQIKQLKIKEKNK